MYNKLAGSSVERLSALSDGIFAFAMTVLVLDLQAPSHDVVHGERAFSRALCALTPRIVTYLMSFLTLGIFWNGQQVQLNLLERSDRHITWIHLALLFGVTLMPFSTKLLSEFITLRGALLCYWANILLLGVVLLWTWRYGVKAKLITDENAKQFGPAVERRIFAAQTLYAAGVLLCLINTYVSIAFIVLVQLNFAIAPRIRGLSDI
jgi:uncharacterized membrane protein